MNKNQLVEIIAEKIKLSKSQTEIMLDATLETIQKSVSKGNDVKLVGFGTFSKLERKAKVGRNPKTGETVLIPKVSVPRFKPGKEFKDIVK